MVNRNKEISQVLEHMRLSDTGIDLNQAVKWLETILLRGYVSKNHGNIQKTARELRMCRPTLIGKLKNLGIK